METKAKKSHIPKMKKGLKTPLKGKTQIGNAKRRRLENQNTTESRTTCYSKKCQTSKESTKRNPRTRVKTLEVKFNKDTLQDISNRLATKSLMARPVIPQLNSTDKLLGNSSTTLKEITNRLARKSFEVTPSTLNLKTPNIMLDKSCKSNSVPSIPVETIQHPCGMKKILILNMPDESVCEDDEENSNKCSNELDYSAQTTGTATEGFLVITDNALMKRPESTINTCNSNTFSSEDIHKYGLMYHNILQSMLREQQMLNIVDDSTPGVLIWEVQCSDNLDENHLQASNNKTEEASSSQKPYHRSNSESELLEEPTKNCTNSERLEEISRCFDSSPDESGPFIDTSEGIPHEPIRHEQEIEVENEESLSMRDEATNCTPVKVEFPSICTHIVGDYSYKAALPSWMSLLRKCLFDELLSIFFSIKSSTNIADI